MAGKLLVRGRLKAARPTEQATGDPEASSSTGGWVRARRGAICGIVAVLTAGLVAASTVIPRGGPLLPVAVLVVVVGWAAIGLLYGMAVVAGRVVRGIPLRVGVLAVGALLLVGLVPADLSSTGWLLAAAFIAAGALGGFGVAQLTGFVAGRRYRLVALLALATGVVGVRLDGCGWEPAGGRAVSGWPATSKQPSPAAPFTCTRATVTSRSSPDTPAASSRQWRAIVQQTTRRREELPDGPEIRSPSSAGALPSAASARGAWHASRSGSL